MLNLFTRDRLGTSGLVVRERGASQGWMGDCSTLFFISKLFDLRKAGLGSCRKWQGITNNWEMKIPTRVTTIFLAY